MNNLEVLFCKVYKFLSLKSKVFPIQVELIHIFRLYLFIIQYIILLSYYHISKFFNLIITLDCYILI